ncbi:ABC-three component system middle component 7 [Acetobacterium malicum]|uniref:ABC-three component system middle component 7 n=1 Tax=Acetobacterium malicum TaxID=52692 RepID=UPI00359483E7
MRFPSKVTPFKNSMLSKFTVVLKELQNQDLTPSELYKKVKKKVDGVAELIDILDCLYALGEIDFREGREVLYYVS